jgi:hypothetical protein
VRSLRRIVSPSLRRRSSWDSLSLAKTGSGRAFSTAHKRRRIPQRFDASPPMDHGLDYEISNSANDLEVSGRALLVPNIPCGTHLL